jgi:hypothetical protein
VPDAGTAHSDRDRRTGCLTQLQSDVRYGLENPSFYTRIYAQRPCWRRGSRARPDALDLSLSDNVRDAILARITTPVSDEQSSTERDAPLASAAISLSAALAQSPRPLNEGETVLMREWLARLSAST